MNPFRLINQYLSKLLEIVNVLITLPLAVLIFITLAEKMTFGAPHLDETSIDLIAAALTIIWVAIINGGIALALEKRRLLEKLNATIDAIDNHANQISSSSSKPQTKAASRVRAKTKTSAKRAKSKSKPKSAKPKK